MKKFAKKFFLAVVMVLFSAGLVFADDNKLTNENSFTGTQNVTASPTADASVTGVVATAGGGFAGVEDSGNGTAIIKEAQQFPQALTPTTNFNFVAPPDPNLQHRPSQSSAKDYDKFIIQRMNQPRFEKMKNVLKKAHEMNSNNRVWEDMEPNMTVEATIFIDQTPLSDTDLVDLVSLKDKRFNNTATVFMGSFIATDKDPVKHPISHPYLSWGVYPYSKMVGANTLVKVDNYHYTISDANSYGAGISGSWARILNCITAATIGLNAGIGGSTAREDVAGGVMYLAFYVPPYAPAPIVAAPAPPCVIAPVPVVKTEPKACNPADIWKRIKDLEKEVKECTRYSYNNLTLREALGYAYIDLYVCTGEKRYLNDAIYHYGIAERNYRKGADINSHKTEADNIIAQVYYNWAGCINELNGRDAAMSFAETKNLERIPSGFVQ